MVQNIVLGRWDGHKIMLSEMDVASKPVSGLDWDGRKSLGRAYAKSMFGDKDHTNLIMTDCELV